MANIKEIRTVLILLLLTIAIWLSLPKKGTEEYILQYVIDKEVYTEIYDSSEELKERCVELETDSIHYWVN